MVMSCKLVLFPGYYWFALIEALSRIIEPGHENIGLCSYGITEPIDILTVYTIRGR